MPPDLSPVVVYFRCLDSIPLFLNLRSPSRGPPSSFLSRIHQTRTPGVPVPFAVNDFWLSTPWQKSGKIRMNAFDSTGTGHISGVSLSGLSCFPWFPEKGFWNDFEAISTFLTCPLPLPISFMISATPCYKDCACRCFDLVGRRI